MKLIHLLLFLPLLAVMSFLPVKQSNQLRVQTVNGTVEGKLEASGIRSFKGIPFAKPPINQLRWQAPRPAESWTGVRKALDFGPGPMQGQPYGDMHQRSPKMSEDCLYLNVWTPAKSVKEKLPVLVYFYGGGYIAGDGSEPRYDGENMAKKGIVTLTVNYRLGVFGFLAHPELSKESAHHSSGNYGLMDQNAALKWVKQNIAAFGGDPSKVTIAGESAGSISVSAQMASPLSKHLIAGAIGESGAMIHPTLAPVTLEQGEQNGLAFAATLNAGSLAALRKVPAEELLTKASVAGAFKTAATIDGYFLPKSPVAIFEAGEQAKVPLLAGWNSTEVPYQAFLWNAAPTPENYREKVLTEYPKNAEQVLKLYPGNTSEEVIASATALASDRFINYSTWKWIDLQSKTSSQPVYRYLFSRPKPGAPGAPHAFEIEYAMGNLDSNKALVWTNDDQKVSSVMMEYFANFIKKGNPNASGLPKWDTVNTTTGGTYMNINVQSKQEQDQHVARYKFLEQQYSNNKEQESLMR
jgi:para-nitrobenzyl esterase